MNQFCVFLLLLMGVFLSHSLVFAFEPLEVRVIGAYHSTYPETGNTAYAKDFMDYAVYFASKKKIEIDQDWFLLTTVALDVKNATVSPHALYASFGKEKVSFQAGLMDLGERDGITLGNQYMTQVGAKYTGYYGNHDTSNPYLSVTYLPVEDATMIAGYSARQEDVSLDSSDDQGNVQVINLLAKATLKPIQLGIEIESKSFENNVFVPKKVKEAEFYLGFAIALTVLEDNLTPFLNFGASTQNKESTQKTENTSEMNLGVDTRLTRNWGATLGFERLGVGNDITTEKWYIGLGYQWKQTRFSLSYWDSNQTVADGFENVSSQIDLELSYQI